jgi:hypothetical protein
VPREGEAIADERLDQADREIERTHEHPVAKEGSRDRRAAIESRFHVLHLAGEFIALTV